MQLINKHDGYSALEHFKKSIKVQPDNDKLQFLTGLSYLATGDRARAVGAVMEVRRLKNEYLAGLLEQIIRQSDQGESVNMNQPCRLIITSLSPVKILCAQAARILPSPARLR
jgi:lipopolysaccharide biosynthesis regulator YciM